MKKKDLGAGIVLSDIARHLNLPITGSPDIQINSISSFDSGTAGSIAFSTETSTRRLATSLASSQIAALVVHERINLAELPPSISYLVSPHPMRSFVDMVPLFFQAYPRTAAISPLASIHPTARIGKNVSIGDFVSIGTDCVIGDDVTIYPQCVVYPEVQIGDGATLHAGAVVRERCIIGPQVILQNGSVVGADGFGYIPDPKEGVKAVPQVGSVVLSPRVEIGANACVDRGAFGDTTIGLATKIDNLVQIGHNVRVGQFSFICGGTAIAGSVEIGNQVTIGGSSAVAGHLKIHDRIRVAGRSGVTSSLEQSGDYGGFPAVPASQWRREMAGLRRVPELISYLRRKRAAEKNSEGED